jgi:hypothetical protein
MNTYIETKGMLVDKLSFMAAVLPNSIPEDFPDMTFDSEFEALFEGIEKLHKKLGPEKYEKCKTMALESRSAYLAGDNERGEDILMDMQLVISGITTYRLRDLEPEARAFVEAGGTLDSYRSYGDRSENP